VDRRHDRQDFTRIVANTLFLPILGVYGAYLILAALVPFEFVIFLSRSGYSLKPLDTRAAKSEALWAGVACLGGELFLAALFVGGPEGTPIRIWFRSLAST